MGQSRTAVLPSRFRGLFLSPPQTFYPLYTFYTVNPKPNVPQLSWPATREASGVVRRSLLLGSELIPQTFYPLYPFYTVNPKPNAPNSPCLPLAKQAETLVEAFC